MYCRSKARSNIDHSSRIQDRCFGRRIRPQSRRLRCRRSPPNRRRRRHSRRFGRQGTPHPRSDRRTGRCKDPLTRTGNSGPLGTPLRNTRSYPAIPAARHSRSRRGDSTRPRCTARRNTRLHHCNSCTARCNPPDRHSRSHRWEYRLRFPTGWRSISSHCRR